MPHRVDFSRNARVYDRRHGAFLTEDESSRLWQAAGLQPGNRVLDIGAGTGRMAVPFAECGTEVVALPFSAASFQVVVIARLLYLTPRWQQISAEVSRVLSAGGCLLHDRGNGHGDEDWVRIREQARSLFEEAGVASPFHLGVRSEADVHDYLESIGFRR